MAQQIGLEPVEVQGVVKSVVWGAALALVLATSPAWAALKIGYVDYSQLLSKSPQAKKIQAEIRTEFLPRQRKIDAEQKALKARADKFQRDSATMTDDERSKSQNDMRARDRDLQQQMSDLQDDFNAKRNEELSKLQHTLVEQVRIYATAQNYDLVLAEGVIYAKSAIDITPVILARLQKAAQSGAGASSHHRAKSSR
ncbi:MAG: OmpH family outer membrane protein [Steroidobacteraceae bacterium]